MDEANDCAAPPNAPLDGVRVLLDALAKVAPEELPMTAGADMAGISFNKLRGQLGALTKTFKRDFNTATWPIRFGMTRWARRTTACQRTSPRGWLGDTGPVVEGKDDRG